MELREYARILLRYWWLIVLLPLVAGALSVLTFEEPPVSYAYRLQYSVSFLPVPREELVQDTRLGAVQASEFVADDLTEILRGSVFRGYVNQYLPAGSGAAQIAQVTRVDKLHRLVGIDISAGEPAAAAAMGAAVREAIEMDLEPLLVELWGSDDLRLELVDEVGPVEVGGGLRSILDLPLRVALALIAAVALAFALDYLDDSIRNRREAEELVGPVLGEIPRGRRA